MRAPGPSSAPRARRRTLSSQEKPSYPGERELRHVGDEDERREVDHDERHDAAVDRLEPEPERRLGDEDVDAERRMKEADRQVHRHHDAEMNRVDAERLDHRDEERREEED